MKYIIIGAGISGLSIANILQNRGHQVVVYERENKPGGLIKCDIIKGSLFHCTGGHVFNTKRTDVLDWFWKYFDKDNEFAKALRNSSVIMENNQFVPYPLENHVYLLNKEIQYNFIHDLLELSQNKILKPKNFEEFLRNRFGKTLYDLYFQPYNYKVWRRDLSKVPLSWLEGKLPMPTVEEMIYNNMNHIEERAFVHSSFYYPLHGGSQFIANRLAENLDIRYNCKISTINKSQDGWLVNDEIADRLIFCGNIKQLPLLLKNEVDISTFYTLIEELEYHGTTSVFCEIDSNEYSWIYQPSRLHESHRIICTGNFSPYNNAEGKFTATVEFTDKVEMEEIIRNLELMPYRPKYLAHHYEEFTYPIQNSETRSMIDELKGRLRKYDIFLLGRFAEWEYYNMDVAIGAAIDLSATL